MKIIDFEIKGNQIKFYVGSDNCEDYWGDDWNDTPYEHNAGSVYDRYVMGYFIKTFDFDDVVMEPCSGVSNSKYSKEDMKNRKVPCVCILPKEYKEEYTWYYEFSDISNNENIIKYYFGDKVDETRENIVYTKSICNKSIYLAIPYAYTNKDIKKLIAEQLGVFVKTDALGFFKDELDKKYVEKVTQNLKLSTYKTYLKSILKINNKMKPIPNLDEILDNLSIEIKDHNRYKDYIYICLLSNDIFEIGNISYR